MNQSHVSTPDWSQIPAPVDDGAARHLMGRKLPSVPLQATSGVMIDLAALSGLTVVYAYPRTGRPDVENPDGWDMIPGARGCTPQSCAFRDHFAELKVLGVDHLFGLSTQDTAYQSEAAERLHLPFPLFVRRASSADQGARPSDLHRWRDDLAQAHGAYHLERNDRACFLPGFPARSECG